MDLFLLHFKKIITVQRKAISFYIFSLYILLIIPIGFNIFELFFNFSMHEKYCKRIMFVYFIPIYVYLIVFSLFHWLKSDRTFCWLRWRREISVFFPTLTRHSHGKDTKREDGRISITNFFMERWGHWMEVSLTNTDGQLWLKVLWHQYVISAT